MSAFRAQRTVIAVGSHPFVPLAWAPYTPQLLTTDSVFELESLPERLAVIGLGAVGLELGQALARLGVEVAGFDRLTTVSGLRDAAVSDVERELLVQASLAVTQHLAGHWLRNEERISRDEVQRFVTELTGAVIAHLVSR